MRDAAVARPWWANNVGHVARAEHNFRLIPEMVAVELLRIAGFEDEMACQRRRPFRLGDVLGGLALLHTGRRHHGRAELSMGTYLVPPVEHGRHAVLRSQLRREPTRK